MEPDEFWHGHARLVEAYRKADEVARKRILDSEWRAGVYVMEAVAAAFTSHQYPREPLFKPAAKAEGERWQDDAMKLQDALRSQFAVANAAIGGCKTE